MFPPRAVHPLPAVLLATASVILSKVINMDFLTNQQ